MPSPPQPLPAAARRSLWVYNLCFPLILVALLPALLLRMLRRGGFRENFGQRLGRYSPETRAHFTTGRWWWIHSISVGETAVALKLARALRQRDPDLRLVISVTTSTGFALAKQAGAEWLTVVYNPIDTPAIVRAALELIRPAQLILIEGEAWPNLLAACHTAAIPTALVNARLSPRSERRLLAARLWVAPIFNLIGRLFVPETGDVERWQNLGVAPARLHITGSIKFDTDGDPPLIRQAEFLQLLGSLGVANGAPILVAGSTWAPEELALARMLPSLRRDVPDLLLILVPRHIERTAQILRDLAPLSLRIARRSTAAADATAAPPDILLIDATGELREWYALATIAFVGKSLPGVAALGGQNPAEPVALGKPTLAGPHMENFRALVQLLESQRAICTVADAATLASSARHLLHDPAARAGLSERARAALAAHRGATAQTAAKLLAAVS